MAAVKVGINGFGRIGRNVFRALMDEAGRFEVAAINDLGDAKSLALLLKYDSVHGRFPGEVKADGTNIIVNGRAIPVTSERSPANLPWGKLGVTVALESTGVFTKKESEKGGYGDHLKAGATRVLVDQVEDRLIVRVRVHGRHHALLDAEAVVQHLRHRRQAVGGAARVRERLVLGLDLVVVHAEHHGQVRLIRRRR